MSTSNERIDVDQPLWDQSSYIGRWKHFAFITDARTTIVPEKKLWEARDLCKEYKIGKEPPDTQLSDIIYAKKLKDSAFHPETEELMPILGRMSFQLPFSVLLTTSMLSFYK
ncbi:sideroflexin-2-like [Calliopsis andreniformis]|uniref:sideroflexin-2-like n=1 Tax=Calliopsis andreniformis TaxID=337506 RepID=UPI003FCC97FC